MKKLDVSAWKKYKIIEVFDIKNTHSILSSEVEEDSGVYPYVTASKENNGVETYVNIAEDKIDKGNCLLIGGKTMVISYQENDFVSNDSHNLALYLKNNKKVTFNTWLFLKTALQRSIAHLYSWGDSISNKSIKNNYIYLPSIDNTPNWEYMDSYITSLNNVVQDRIKNYKKIDFKKKNKIDVSEWGEFHIYDVFDIYMGTKLDKIKLDTTEEEVAFVGRSNANNGVTQKCKKIDGLEPYKAGCLSLALGGYLGSCFVQEEPFYTSQNVIVLIPKQDITFETKQFIATAIFKESQNNYKAFVKELNAHVKKDFKFKLPMDSEKKPNYEYMHNFMCKVRAKSNATLNNLLEI